ncbi:MAG: alpha/beta hydrolase [Candidatus Cloacimonetes bacterium]|jgi:dienelactone hydrolase|nr:alpha/beta hydrolase [Candidatus Cloacimonadota bacterium]
MRGICAVLGGVVLIGAGAGDAAAQAGGGWQPPVYADTTSFTERELTVGSAPFELPATLTIPNTATGGPVPVVVLVHGSGPNDHDGTVGSRKPLKDLAWGLASRGVAVLRYEKRTRLHAAKMDLANATVEDETIADVLAALEVARAQPEINAERAFVLGHSLGAMVAPEIAVRDGRLAGVIMMAAGGRPLAESMLAQLDYIATQPENQIPQAKAQIAQMRAAAQRVASKEAAPDERGLGVPAQYFYDLNEVAAPSRALDVKAPMLILQGERDYQVTMEDFAIWRRTLEGRTNVSLVSYPGLDHLFVAGENPSTPRETMLAPGNVAQQVIDDVAEFVKGR